MDGRVVVGGGEGERREGDDWRGSVRLCLCSWMPCLSCLSILTTHSLLSLSLALSSREPV